MPRAVAERGDVVPVLAEVFRSHGFDGASLAVITEHTGLGKGSLYNFFPRGKDEMAEAVLDEVDAWFQTAVYLPLRGSEPATARLERMFDEVETYFRSGRRICLFGAFALGLERDRFADRVRAYFTDWVDSLAGALADTGHGRQSRPLAEEVVAGIQGALILARALDDPDSFTRILTRLRRSVGDPNESRA